MVQMNVFISYSTPDVQIVRQLADQLRQYANVYFWQESKQIGKDAWDTIFNWIDNSDLVVVLITGNTVSRGLSVGQEVGRAKTKDKTILPMVSPEVPSSDLGFLSGITYQPVDVRNPTPAIEAIRRATQNYKLVKEQNLASIIGLAVLAFFLWLLSRE